MKHDFGFIAIGDEITDGDITNTNSGMFAKHLVAKDFNIGFHICCKDDSQDIISSLKFLKENHKNIITIGGLGPTEDDLTTQTIADFFGEELILDQKSWQKLEKRMLAEWNYAHWSDMYWSEHKNLMNIGILITSTNPVLLTSKCPHAFKK